MTSERTDAAGENVQQLRNVLQKYWGFDSFRALQQESMTSIMEGRDTLVVLPTGGGKSLCYQAPAMCLDGMAIVVSPLISLMKDQVDTARACGLPARLINSSIDARERFETWGEVRDGKVRLLYVSPERLTQSSFLDQLADVPLSMLAIDEAHCISQWGHDFRPHYRELCVLRERFPEVPLHAFTATATADVQEDIAHQLGLKSPQFFVGSFDRPNLSYRVIRKGNLTEQIEAELKNHVGESGIIYCITRKEVDEWTAFLNSRGVPALPYHAGLTDEQRHQNQEAFLNDDAGIVVATVAFGMGIDKSNIRFVIHVGMPKSIEHYQQESGRAGRDGLDADCVLLFGNDDLLKWQFMTRDLPPEVSEVSAESLRKMVGFCEGMMCRHRALVRHFGQDLAEKCGTNCDVCTGNHTAVEEPLKIAQMILSSVYRQEQRFGVEYTIAVLKGSRSKKVLGNGHDKLSTYGLLKDHSKPLIQEWIGQLIQQECLHRVGEYNMLRLKEPGWLVLRGEWTPELVIPQRAELQVEAPTAKGKQTSWDGVEMPLFEKLRELRSTFASERGVPPYVIFSDATLRDLARKRPTTPDAILAVYGVGQKKRDDFGTEFLEVIDNYCREHQVESNVDNSNKPADPPDEQPRVNRSALTAFPLFAAGKSLAEVAQTIGRAHSTTCGYLAEYLREKDITDPTPWVDAPTAARIRQAIEHVGANGLKPIFEHLNGEVDYDSIRIVVQCWLNGKS
ncbi:MAG: DNA helicase RecQ [Planctomycetaceae bacterium]|nr:DNA helicase RecQ [Planctomycetaceae bacterium]MCB9951441.1 DNA helicase RecQ [Planctomycetaceae bacterium]